MAEKISKKADAKVYALAAAIKPGISKNTTYQEAWEIIAEHAGLEASIHSNDTRVDHETNINIYKGDSLEYSVPVDHSLAFIKDEGNWDWTYVYRTIIEYVVKHKLVKKPRAKRKA